MVLLVVYTKQAYIARCVHYKNEFRVLMSLPRQCTASGMFAKAHNYGIPATMRKNAATLFYRVHGIRNSISVMLN